MDEDIWQEGARGMSDADRGSGARSTVPEPIINVVRRAEALRIRVGDVEREREQLRAALEAAQLERDEAVAAEIKATEDNLFLDQEWSKTKNDLTQARARIAVLEEQRRIWQRYAEGDASWSETEPLLLALDAADAT